MLGLKLKHVSKGATVHSLSHTTDSVITGQQHVNSIIRVYTNIKYICIGKTNEPNTSTRQCMKYSGPSISSWQAPIPGRQDVKMHIPKVLNIHLEQENTLFHAKGMYSVCSFANAGVYYICIHILLIENMLPSMSINNPLTRVTWNAEIPSAAWISICEPTSQETVKQLGLWNSLGIKYRRGWRVWNRPVKHPRYSWLSGGYMVAMYFQWWWSQTIWYFKSNLPPPPPPQQEWTQIRYFAPLVQIWWT